MKVVILAGGYGTRIREIGQDCPKPMIEIGGKPVLWHIMKEYSYYGFNEFVICAGYKQDYIKDWFANYFVRSNDVTFDYRNNEYNVTVHHGGCEPWIVTVADTGLDTKTGGRIKQIQPYIGHESFMMTYGDGVCDVDIGRLVKFHKDHGKLATLTAVTLQQDKGVLRVEEDTVRSFREKRNEDGLTINAGYMVLEPEVFDYIEGDQTVFEDDPLERLAEEGQLVCYRHEGFWQCMDNGREKEILEKLLQTGQAPWIKW